MGAVSSIVFATRNAEKCATQGDTTRGAVSVCQAVSSVDSIASSSVFSNIADAAGSVLGKADKAVETVFSTIGGESGTQILKNIKSSTGASSSIGAVAQDVVNPLLCVSAGIRVLKDDDQYAALIEETSAMGAMFGCEALMKYARSSVTGTTQATKGLSGKVASALSNSSSTIGTKLNSALKSAKNWYEKLGATSSGDKKQLLVRLGIDALFVCGSILAYNTGHKIGESISNRDESTETGEETASASENTVSTEQA